MDSLVVVVVVMVAAGLKISSVTRSTVSDHSRCIKSAVQHQAP